MNIEAFFKITYGLYIISSKAGNHFSAYIANTAFQITATPPQIAISCNKNNFTCKLIDQSGQFAISVLNQQAPFKTIELFGFNSGKSTNKFANINYTNSKAGTPVVLEDTIAWFDCKVNQALDVGTHILFIATIIENDILDPQANPLTYSFYRDVKGGFAPENAPTYIDKSKLNSNYTTMNNQENKKYKCQVCGYVYDEKKGDKKQGIEPGTPFDELPTDWKCPVCKAPKTKFKPL